jgi:hypothetical protein
MSLTITDPPIFRLSSDDVMEILDTTRPNDEPPVRLRVIPDRRKHDGPAPNPDRRQPHDVDSTVVDLFTPAAVTDALSAVPDTGPETAKSPR